MGGAEVLAAKASLSVSCIDLLATFGWRMGGDFQRNQALWNKANQKWLCINYYWQYWCHVYKYIYILFMFDWKVHKVIYIENKIINGFADFHVSLIYFRPGSNVISSFLLLVTAERYLHCYFVPVILPSSNLSLWAHTSFPHWLQVKILLDKHYLGPCPAPDTLVFEHSV